MEANNFDLRSAVLLAAALIGHIARRDSLQALIIKGPGAVSHGVRPEGPSMDVDVLVRESDYNKLLTTLIDGGWNIRPVDDSDGFPNHSDTLYHPSWPCDIDLHIRYPGMEADYSHVFRALWEEKVCWDVAGQTAMIAGPTGATLIQALHSLRAIWLAKNSSEYDFLLASNSLPSLEILLEMAEKTGCLATCSPFFEEKFGHNMTNFALEQSPEWRARRSAEIPGLFRAQAIARAPWASKFVMIRQAIFPSVEHMSSQNLYANIDTWSARSRLRMSRLVLFLRMAPKIIGHYVFLEAKRSLCEFWFRICRR